MWFLEESHQYTVLLVVVPSLALYEVFYLKPGILFEHLSPLRLSCERAIIQSK
jgi:hypothetical protein